MMTDTETYGMAIALALADIRQAAKDFFDLHPNLREITIKIADDGEISVKAVAPTGAGAETHQKGRP